MRTELHAELTLASSLVYGGLMPTNYILGAEQDLRELLCCIALCDVTGGNQRRTPLGRDPTFGPGRHEGDGLL